MEKKHYEEIDGIRAVAAMAVVVIHASSGYVTYAGGMQLNQLARFAVPLFILLSGFGAGAPAALAQPRKARLIHRLQRIVPPYIIWSAVYLALLWFVGTPSPRPLFAICTGSAYVHLYFLFVLLQFEILVACCGQWLAAHPQLVFGLSAAITLGLELWMNGGDAEVLWFPELPVPLTRFFPLYLLFYMAGFLLRPHYEKFRKYGIRRLLAAAAIWSVSIVLVLMTAQVEFLRNTSMRPDLAIYMFATAFFLQQLLLCCRLRWLHKALAQISKLSFVLYLSHPLLLRLVIHSGILDGRRMAVCLPMLFVVGLGGGLLLAKLISYLPLGNLLGSSVKKS